MAIILGGINLPDLVIGDEGLGRVPGVAMVETSIINTPIVYVGEQASGFLIDLVGGEDWGWMSRDTIEAVNELSHSLEAVYDLQYEDDLYRVRFRLEDPPAVFGVPVITNPEKSSADWFKNVTIKLMEVN